MNQSFTNKSSQLYLNISNHTCRHYSYQGFSVCVFWQRASGVVCVSSKYLYCCQNTRIKTNHAYNHTGQWLRALRIDSGGFWTVPLVIRSEFKNKTITVISSWKCRRTFLSIDRRSEYRISRFLAASCKAALISLLALPCININK